MGEFGWIAIIALAVAVLLAARAASRRTGPRRWRKRSSNPQPVIYLDARMAVGASVLGHKVPDGYRLASLFFGVGLLDRTQHLDHGFPYEILDPIPDVSGLAEGSGPTMAALCDARGRALVARSRESDRPIRLYWSGGIDSTAACVAILKALDEAGRGRLEVVYSGQSVKEYRLFFRRFIKANASRIKVRKVGEALRADRINVTGEHGDQLFGSAKALALDFADLRAPWEQALPRLLRGRFDSAARAEDALRYLVPQFSGCPVPLRSLFDLLWWMNFSMKWQAVSLRMLSSADLSQWSALEPTLHHFYRTEDFQRWALTHPGERIRDSFATYKWPLKDFIRDHTGDADYHADKEKEPSLRGVLIGRRKGMGMAVDTTRAIWLQPFDQSLRRRDRTSGGSGLGFSYEQGTWDDLGDGGDGE